MWRLPPGDGRLAPQGPRFECTLLFAASCQRGGVKQGTEGGRNHPSRMGRREAGLAANRRQRQRRVWTRPAVGTRASGWLGWSLGRRRGGGGKEVGMRRREKTPLSTLATPPPACTCADDVGHRRGSRPTTRPEVMIRAFEQAWVVIPRAAPPPPSRGCVCRPHPLPPHRDRVPASWPQARAAALRRAAGTTAAASRSYTYSV
jgi:hypothetical protein